MNPEHKHITFEYLGLDVDAYVSIGYEGDPSIPGGTRETVAIEEYTIGNEYGDLSEYFTEDFLNQVEGAIRDNL